jgi:ABC-2 type transport system ATP-binding protein
VTGAVLVRELRRSFAATTAVDGASWAASAGTVTALLGPNGAGKTTTVECLEGLQRPDAGSVRVLGADPWRSGPDHRARVGVMLQEGGLPTTSRPLPLLRHLAALYAEPALLDELVARLGIEQFARTTVRRMSGGQRQRVALAAALLPRPAVLFLDEPTAGLDPQARRATWELVEALRHDGVTVVLTTHFMDEAERLADEVVVVDHGRVIAVGSPGELMAAGAGGSLRFEGPPGLDVAGLAAALPAASRVDEVAPGRYVVHGDVDTHLLADLTRWCADREVMPEGLTVGRRSLEDVFLDLTGSDLRA